MVFANPYATLLPPVSTEKVDALVTNEEKSIERSSAKRPPVVTVRVNPSSEKMLRWVVIPTGPRSANTGQMTCSSWAQSVQLINATELLGPFHGAVVSGDSWEDFNDGKVFWNNTAQLTIAPLAARWDIPIWMGSSGDDPTPSWSALFQWSFLVQGSATLALVWDAPSMAHFLTGWVDGLVKAKVLDGLQGLGWKQKMTEIPPSHVGVLDYTIKDGTIKNFGWRLLKLKMNTDTLGCSKNIAPSSIQRPAE